MTHYPPSKIQSDPKNPMSAARPNPGKAATPTSPGDKPRNTLAEGVDTGAIQPGHTQGANLA
jgi:hypothetical protein